MMLSAWGFAMVIAFFLFLYTGHLLDEILGTYRFHAGIVLAGDFHLRHEALSGSKETNEGFVVAATPKT